MRESEDDVKRRNIGEHTMTIHEMQNEIQRLKKENDVCILAHSYQGEEICEVADFVGDSFGLSVKASKTPQKRFGCAVFALWQKR